MDTVLQLARHILRFQPNKEASRLCLYHFLIHHCEPTDKVTPELIERFNRFVLSFEHWRKNRHELVQEVQYLLHHFAETYQLPLNFKNMTMADHWQVVAVENPIDCLKLLEKKYQDNPGKMRLIPAGPQSFALIEMHENQNLTVTHLNNLMIINQAGELEPLNDFMKIHYTSDLTLEYQVVQYVEIAPSVVARFMIMGGQGVHGHTIRGYTFQKAEEYKGGAVNQYPQIYYAIKRFEQHYVDRKSDPMYVELTQILEKAVELVNMRHPESVGFAEAAMERGQLALDNIFVGDNMIRLLVQTLKSALQTTRTVMPKQGEPRWQMKDEILVE